MKLELRKLCKSFSGQPVFRNLDYTSTSSQALVLLGASGCGKSTLLRIMCGLLAPDSGEVLLNGQAIAREADALRDYRKTLGIVFQSANLFAHLSALENVLLPLEKAHHYTKIKALARADELLQRFQLSSHAHKKPAQLSGGQRQRIAIARALAHHPKLLFLDEPTSALDPEMAEDVLSCIDLLKHEGTDFVLVTHQLAFARRVADEIIFLGEGRIIEAGLSVNLFQQPKTPQLQAFLSKYLDGLH